MGVLIVNHEDVARLLPMDECLDVMAEALRTLGRGDALLPLRTITWAPGGRGGLAMMPAILGAPRALGVKALTVFPVNEGTPFDSHQGVVLLFEAEHGSLVAILDATAITAIRTAAVSGVATRTLAREDAGDLAILGTGTQARGHLAAMRVARPLRRVRVYSPSRENAEAFAERESRRHGIRVEAAASAREVVEGADLVCTATSSAEPVLRGEWLQPGTHVNAVGACFPSARELDTAAVVRSRLFVDRLESALHEAGDFLIPKAEGAIGDDHIVGELGDVLLGRVSGRRSGEEITVFKSLGIAVEDVAAAHYVYAKALEAGGVMQVELGGLRLPG